MKKYSLTDDIGIIHAFDKVPQRIISLVPSQTELLVDLGLESKIVGITKFCVHPTYLKEKITIVGGTKKVDYDKIKTLNPDIIICNKEENTLEIVENLSKVATVWVTNVITVEDNFKMIKDFGQLFDCEIVAEHWNFRIEEALGNLNKIIECNSIKKVAYLIWKNPYMAVGTNNYINSILQLNRFENAFANVSRYPEIDIQEIDKNRDLEYVFLSSEPYPFQEKDVLGIAPFCHLAKIILVDGEMFSWHGSRLLKAINYFTSLQQRL